MASLKQNMPWHDYLCVWLHLRWFMCVFMIVYWMCSCTYLYLLTRVLVRLGVDHFVSNVKPSCGLPMGIHMCFDVCVHFSVWSWFIKSPVSCCGSLTYWRIIPGTGSWCWFLVLLKFIFLFFVCFCVQRTTMNLTTTSWVKETPAHVWRQVSANSTNFRTTLCSVKPKQSGFHRTHSITRWPSSPIRTATNPDVLQVWKNYSEQKNQPVWIL